MTLTLPLDETGQEAHDQIMTLYNHIGDPNVSHPLPPEPTPDEDMFDFPADRAMVTTTTTEVYTATEALLIAVGVWHDSEEPYTAAVLRDRYRKYLDALNATEVF